MTLMEADWEASAVGIAGSAFRRCCERGERGRHGIA